MAAPSHHSDTAPLQKLTHESVPGYLKAFVIAFGIMAVYLAVILISSPGKAKKHYGDHADHATESEHHSHEPKSESH